MYQSRSRTVVMAGQQDTGTEDRSAEDRGQKTEDRGAVTVVYEPV